MGTHVIPFPQVYTFTHAYESKTAEHLTLTSLGKSKVEQSVANDAGDRSKSAFIEDEAIPPQFRSKLSDYLRSGYDRGHMYGSLSINPCGHILTSLS